MNSLQFARTWKILLLGPGSELIGGIQSVLKQELPSAELFDVRSYPDVATLRHFLIGQSFSACFLDAASSRETAFALMGEIQRVAPELPVVALLNSNQPDLILGGLRHGAAEFLIQPFHATQLMEAMGRVLETHPHLVSAKTSARMIAVIPAKGACGASTIALNLAFQKKHLQAKKVLLADFDPLTGTQSFLLKAKPVYSFLDAIKRGNSLDQDVWKGLVNSLNGVDLLFAPEAIVEELYSLTDPSSLLEFIRTLYDVAILDLGIPYGAWNLRVAQMADEVLLVATADSQTLLSVRRVLRYLERNNVQTRKIKLIINRFHRNFSLDADSVRSALQMEIFATLPADYESVQRALIDGKTIPAGTAFGKGLMDLAEALAPPRLIPVVEKKPRSRTGALSGLFKFFSAKVMP